jgi:uncharacterized protein (DUF2236 family)
MSDETHYFTPGRSMARRVHGDRAVGLLYGQRALLTARVREIFGIRWTRAHESAFRSITAAHRRARHAFPRRVRRGRNDVFFDTVARSEHLRGGTATPELTPSGS